MSSKYIGEEASNQDATVVNDDCSTHANGSSASDKDQPLASIRTWGTLAAVLLARGFWPIGLYAPGVKRKSGVTNGKEPYGLAWGLVRQSVKLILDRFKRKQIAGLGIGLGPGRGPGGGWLVDLEGDGPLAEASRLALLGGEVIDSTGWGGKRGDHQLLLADGERLGRITPRMKGFQVRSSHSPGVYHLPQYPDLELRLGGYKDDGQVKQLQSAVPPTPDTEGKPRVWNGRDRVALAPEALYKALEAIADEAEAKARANAPEASPRKPNSWEMRINKCRTDAWLKGALEQAARRIERTGDGLRRNTYRDEAFILAGYLWIYEQYGIGYSEQELATTLKSARAVNVSANDPVVPVTVDEAIAAGKGVRRELKQELYEELLLAVGVGATRSTEPHPSPESPPPGFTTPEPAELPTEITPLAEALVRDLDDRIVSLHISGTGTGKTFGAAQVLAFRARRGRCTLLAVPTLRIASEVEDILKRIAPDLYEADAVAVICGQRMLPIDDDDDAADEDSHGSYQIFEWTRAVIATHSQMSRRGMSRFMRGVWTKIGRRTEEHQDGPRPPFDIIIDEASLFVEACTQEIDGAHRTQRRRVKDGSGTNIIPLQKCPKTKHSGNCGNCLLRKQGGELDPNKFDIRELYPPKTIQENARGEELRRARMPMVFNEDDLALGHEHHIARTTFAASVTRWKGMPLGPETRKASAIEYYATNPEGDQVLETPDDILGNMLMFAFRPTMTWEYPIDKLTDEKVDPELLKLRLQMQEAHKKSKGRAAEQWDKDILFPIRTCQVPRLRFADTMPLEKLRRYAAEEGVGVCFLGASLSQDEKATILEVFPKIATHDHPSSPRKIRQAAVAFLDKDSSLECLIDGNRKLYTLPLEKHGPGIVFATQKAVAERIYKKVMMNHPSVHMASENSEITYTYSSIHKPTPASCYVTYSRGVLGVGANLLGLKFLVIDSEAFRALGSFIPGTITAKEFEKSQAEERNGKINQNLGRGFRGEEGKTIFVLVINADGALRKAIAESHALNDGCELPPVFATGDDVAKLIDQADKWLAAGGGDWPTDDPSVVSKKTRGRPAKRTKDDVLAEVDAAITAGMPWHEFSRRQNVRRMKFTHSELMELKMRFAGPVAPEDDVEWDEDAWC